MNTVFKDYIRVIEAAHITAMKDHDNSRIDLLQPSEEIKHEEISNEQNVVVRRFNQEYEIKNPRTLFSHPVSHQPSMMQT